MKSRLFLFLTVIIMIIGFTGCKCLDFIDHDCIHGEGPVVQEIRDVEAFHSVESDGSFRIFLSQGDRQEVVVEAESSLIPLIRTTVHGDGYLVIDTRQCFNSSRTIRVYITARDLRDIVINGSGDIIGETPFNTGNFSLMINGSGDVNLDVTAENIRTHTNGSGDIRLHAVTGNMTSRITGSGNMALTGRADHFQIAIAASGDIHAFDFPVKTCTVSIAGSGNARINVSGELDITIAGSGSVHFMGHPDIIRSTVIGSGRIIQVD